MEGRGPQGMEAEGDGMIVVNVEPVGQMRARSANINGHAMTYKAKRQRKAEVELITHLKPHAPAAPSEMPLEITFRAFMPMPKGMSKSRREMANAGQIRPCVKPDADNLAKHALDCMQGLFFKDDKQVVRLSVEKFYSDRPRWEIEIKERS